MKLNSRTVIPTCIVISIGYSVRHNIEHIVPVERPVALKLD